LNRKYKNVSIPFKSFNYLSLIMKPACVLYRARNRMRREHYRENRTEREKIQREVDRKLKKYADAFSLEDK